MLLPILDGYGASEWAEAYPVRILLPHGADARQRKEKNTEPAEAFSSIAVACDYLRRRFVVLSQNLTQQE
jgi:hypothetical protein